MSKYLVTAALPYANGPLHIGHLAGCYLPADIYVRYLRMKGEDVKFICGSDEHGVAITIKARKEGKTPREIVDHYHALIRDSFHDFGISFDIYHRTSDPLHHETASAFFTDLYNKGLFLEEESEQYFDEEAGLFLADRYITGTCPNCSNPNAYGDQCERCGTSLSPKELIDPHSQLSGSKPVLKTTKHWYLPLDKMQEEWLGDWILSKEGVWKKNVVGQCKSWLDQGLQPRAVTRDLDWGVPVPLEDAKGKVLYVWFDAPIGYISATRALLPDSWEAYWKNNDSKLIHFIGKDNIVFHCIIFPAMLKAHGDYILPDNVPANEFLNLEGDKISTSRNWAVWLHEYLRDFPGKQDVLRYVLCSSAPETKDNDFTWKDFLDKNNNELVAVLGNFINRTLVLTNKYFNGIVPQRGEMLKEDIAFREEIKNAPTQMADSLDRYRFREALSLMMDVARAGNKYLADTEPWKLSADQKGRIGSILSHALDTAAQLTFMMEPFMPFSAMRLREMLNMGSLTWQNIQHETLLGAGHKLGVVQLLFEKLDESIVEIQMQKLQQSKQQNEEVVTEENIFKPVPQKAETTFDDFAKMDLRVGTVLSAEKVEKADKLLKLTVDTGLDVRTIVSGIALHFTPEEVTGRQVVVLANLAPRKLRGIESQGMILLAENEEGKLVFIEPAQVVKPGSAIS